MLPPRCRGCIFPSRGPQPHSGCISPPGLPVTACWTDGRCWLHLQEHGPGSRDALLMDSLHLSAPRNRPQSPVRLPVTPASTEVSAQVWLRSHGLGRARALATARPGSPQPRQHLWLGKKHHLRGPLSRVRRGCKWKHNATSLLGDKGRQTAPRLGGTRAAGKTWYSLCASLASAPGKGAHSPFAVSHITAGLAEIWALFPCRAARCSQQGNVYVSLGLLPARDAAPLPRIAIKQRRALECFWESAGIGLHMNSPAQFRL